MLALVVKTMIDSKIGYLLAQRYQIQQLIGTGAMGQVYLAKDVLLGGVPVAIKFLSLLIQNEKMRVQERFEREAKTCALLGQKSIHIVRVMDYGVDENGTPFYVMEYLQGNSLNEIIRLEPLSLARFLSLARQISLGLHCAHQGIPIDDEIYLIVHRDIKPSNILVVQDSSFGELAKILDFGIAKLLQPDVNQTNYYLGTLAYSSPEQMEGKELDNRSDIYSLGVVMFEMLTGKMPIEANIHSFGGWYKAHQSQIPRSFNSTNSNLKLPQKLENLVMKCLAKSPFERPQSVSEILQALLLLEQHYGAGHHRGIEEASTAVALVPTEVKHVEGSLLTTQVFQTLTWPKDKPIADIVFPHPISSNSDALAALWIMLPKKEIQKRIVCTRYNQFLFIPSPHPMMLWITVLHNHEHGPKWLPHYLDMKTRRGLQMARMLGEMGFYHLLLFARESPERISTSLISTIASAQRELLQQWAISSEMLLSVADPQISKDLLKKEFEKIKPQILSKLKQLRTDSPCDLSG